MQNIKRYDIILSEGGKKALIDERNDNMKERLARLMEMREEIWDNMSAKRVTYLLYKEDYKAVTAEIKYVRRMLRNARKA